MLCTLLQPTGGAAFVNGDDATRDPARVPGFIGIK